MNSRSIDREERELGEGRIVLDIKQRVKDNLT
uniref:Uncharacterized protein n=1 Tax=Rhizophora mucronata TaxID=61149 RepID=A0A2P2N2J0_RHIMU